MSSLVTIEEVHLDQLAAVLSEPRWARGPVLFVGDVGGTHARLGFGRRRPRPHSHSGGNSNSNSNDINSNGGDDDGESARDARADHGSDEALLEIIHVRFSMTDKSIEQLVDFFRQIIVAIKNVEWVRERRQMHMRSGDGGGGAAVAGAALSIPGPVDATGRVAGPFNNLKGMARLSDYPVELFPASATVLLNDIEAGGYGLAALSAAAPNAFAEYFAVMWSGTAAGTAAAVEVPPQQQKKSSGHHQVKGVTSPPRQQQTAAAAAATLLGGSCLVFAPGTGLGSSLLYPLQQHPKPIHNYIGDSSNVAPPPPPRYGVLPLEFGSTSVPSRFGAEAAYVAALGNFLSRVRGTQQQRQPESEQGQGEASQPLLLVPTGEDCCCGDGIVFNYLMAQEARQQKQRDNGSSESSHLSSVCRPPTEEQVKGVMDGRLTPSHVAELAYQHQHHQRQQHQGRDPAAVEALMRAYECLMWTCAEAAMSFLPQMVVIAGENVVRNAFLFEEEEGEQDEQCKQEQGERGEGDRGVGSTRDGAAKCPDQRCSCGEVFTRRLQRAAFSHPMQQRNKMGFIGRSTFVRQRRHLNLNLLGCIEAAAANNAAVGR